MINAIGVGPTMWVYAAFNVAAFLFTWRRMPELGGYSLEQIEGKLRGGSFRSRRLPARPLCWAAGAKNTAAPAPDGPTLSS